MNHSPPMKDKTPMFFATFDIQLHILSYLGFQDMLNAVIGFMAKIPSGLQSHHWQQMLLRHWMIQSLDLKVRHGYKLQKNGLKKIATAIHQLFRAGGLNTKKSSIQSSDHAVQCLLTLGLYTENRLRRKAPVIRDSLPYQWICSAFYLFPHLRHQSLAQQRAFFRLPLYLACKWNDFSALLNQPLSNCKVQLKRRDHLGRQALHWAYKLNRLDWARLFIKYGADIHVPMPDLQNDEYSTLLHCACADGKQQWVAFLWAYGAQLHSDDNYLGETPLHVAARYNQIHIARFLLKAGAKWDVEDTGGWLPVDWAVWNAHTEMRTLLEAAEHRPPKKTPRQWPGTVARDR